MLISHGGNVNEKDENNVSLLMSAMINESSSMVQHLIDLGSNFHNFSHIKM